MGGHRYRFNLTGDRRKIAVDDPRLEDRLADNSAKNDIAESESLLFGSGSGVDTDIETEPTATSSWSRYLTGRLYEIIRG